MSEVAGVTLPYDNILTLRDRMWEIAPSTVRYDVTEPTTVDITAAGLASIAGLNAGKASGVAFRKPIINFYQTDPISRACVLDP